MLRRAWTIFAPLAIVGVGVGVALILRLNAPKAEDTRPERSTVTVEVAPIEPKPTKVRIQATGLAIPSQQITVNPEINGRIVAVSPSLVPGGRFRKGQWIARIDRRELELALQQEKSRVRHSQLELQLETGRNRVAAREWELVGNEKVADSSLALRTPQLEVAKENLEAARSGLKRAELNLERTVLLAPFDAVVTKKHVDVGQLVGPNTPIASLIGTRTLWARVSLPVEKLGLINTPGIHEGDGSAATVRQRVGRGRTIERQGRVIRLEGELDAQTRTATLIIEIARPFDTGVGQLPLLPGAYVDVEIHGQTIDDGFLVPRAAVTGHDTVWVVDDQQTLQKRQVEVAWRDQGSVLVVDGLLAGEPVVVSPVAMPIEGMRVETRVVAEGE